MIYGAQLKNQRIVLPNLNSSEEHRLLDNQIIVQKEQESLPNDLRIHDIGNYTISTLLVGGIVVAIIVWQVRKYLQVCKKRSPTTNKTPGVSENIELEDVTYAEIGEEHRNKPQPLPATRTGFQL